MPGKTARGYPASVGGLLLLLTASLVAAAGLCAAVLLWDTYRAGRDAVERQLAGTARALALAVDRQIAQAEAALGVLAASHRLRDGDIAGFEAHARDAVASLPDYWVVLAEENGRQLINTRLPKGAPPPTGPLLPELWGRLHQGRTVVSNLFVGTQTKRWTLAVDVPVMREGRAVYSLSLATLPGTLARILDAQRLPPSWVGTILDGKGTVVARSRDGERFVGAKATDDVLSSMERADEAVVESVSLEGVPTVLAYSRSPAYGWSFIVAVPRAELLAEARRPLLVGGVAALLLLAAGTTIAAALGLRIARSSRRLADAATALGRDAPRGLAVARSGLVEIDRVAGALEAAAAALDAREAELRRGRDELEARVATAVAERARALEDLAQARKLDALGQLTGGVAHDFNNLLQALSACLQLVERRAGDPAQVRALLAEGRQAVDRGARLTRQLMTFARRQALQPEVVCLRERVLAMRELLARTLRGDIRLLLELEPGLWPVEVDPTQFELALVNLAVNARDAMPEGGLLRVAARNLPGDAGGDRVAVEVSDTGIGMTREVLARVFEPFFTTKARGQGTGLGLSQVHGFAHQSGGAAEIASEPGRGTTVRLLLPRAARAAPVAVPAAAPAEVPPPARIEARVLLVEDDPVVSAAVRRMLEEMGCTVAAVDSADGALSVLRRGDPLDLLFSDVVMPGQLNGVDLARAAARLRPGLPVLLTTGYSEDMAGDPGLPPVLPKPYTAAALAEAVAAVLAGTRAAGAAAPAWTAPA
ncbi:MAG TPA: ATP-binding protein [Azospirillaceae bacterium]|nr:ATP-binding protein [Azospirillaceae bacterium]